MNRLWALGAVALTAAGLLAGCSNPTSQHDCYRQAVSKGGMLGSIPLNVEPTALDGWSDAVWVVSAKGGSLWQVAGDGSTRGPYNVGQSPSAVVDDFSCRGDRVWIALFGADTVVEVDGKTGAVLETVSVGKGPVALATSAWDTRALWVANEKSDSVSRIDMITAAVTETVSVGRSPRSLSVSVADLVYVANHDDGTISVVDAAKSAVTATIPVGSGPSSVAYDFGVPVFDGPPSKVWVANTDDETVMKIDPATNRILRTWSVPGKPLMVVPIGVRAWVVISKYGVMRLDDSPKQNLGDAAIDTGSDPVSAIDADFASGRDLLWIANGRDRTLARVWS